MSSASLGYVAARWLTTSHFAPRSGF